MCALVSSEKLATVSDQRPPGASDRPSVPIAPSAPSSLRERTRITVPIRAVVRILGNYVLHGTYEVTTGPASADGKSPLPTGTAMACNIAERLYLDRRRTVSGSRPRSSAVACSSRGV